MSDPTAAPAPKAIYSSMTMQGLLVSLFSILAALPAWKTMSGGEQGALISAGAAWVWALIGRLRQGDIKILPGKATAALLVVGMSLGLAAGCAATPQVAAQRGNEAGALAAGVSPTAPVNQGMSPIITNVFPVLVIGNGGAPMSPESVGALVKAMGTEVNAGHEANGDVRAQGRQEGGGQSATQSADQKADAKTDVSPAVGDSAIKALTPSKSITAPAIPSPKSPKPTSPETIEPPPPAPSKTIAPEAPTEIVPPSTPVPEAPKVG